MNTFQILIVCVMVVTGTLNTISATLQISRPAKGKLWESDHLLQRYFKHYYVQTMFMMLGECMCMVAYLILKFIVYKDNPKKLDGDAKPMNPLVLWPAAALDIVGTSLDYMGLAFMKDAGLFQMLRVSPIIFCGLLSIPILKQRLKWFNWSGIVVVCIGLIIKAIPQVMNTFDPPEDKAYHVACLKNLLNRNETMGVEDEDEGIDATYVIGIALVLIGEFFHGCQFVYEEKFITKYDLSPLKAVGLEGINGFITCAVLLVPAYFISMPDSLGGAALGPDGRFEDVLDAFAQMGNSGWLLLWTLGNMCSIAVFNFAGITVTKELSATTRAVLDQLRIILIWAFFLIDFGLYLCHVQTYFHYTAPIGLTIMVAGVWLYNDVIIMPLVRKYLLKSDSKEENNTEKTDSNVA